MRRQLTGAQVMVWHQNSLLLITNSYRGGLYLPGGGIGRTEPAATAAVRELREETGIEVSEGELSDLGSVDYEIRGVGVRDRLFAVKLKQFQLPKVDGLEVVSASFFRMNSARRVAQLSHLRRFMHPETAI